MNNLHPLLEDAFTYFENIADLKRMHRRPILSALKPSIRRLYNECLTNRLSLQTLTPALLSEDEKEALKHCYLVPVQAMHDLRYDIENYQTSCNADIAAFCQYCGLNYDTRTLDHYLPKDVFPEFSTLNINLLPCCTDCNTLKDTAWLIGSDREIINFYYDTLPTRQFLYSQLSQTGNVFNSSFALSSQSADYCGLENTIKGHFRRLDLLTRYAKASAQILSEQEGLIKSIATEDSFSGLGKEEIFDIIINILTKNANRLAAKFSKNHWKVPLYQSIIDNKNFLNKCIFG